MDFNNQNKSADPYGGEASQQKLIAEQEELNIAAEKQSQQSISMVVQNRAPANPWLDYDEDFDTFGQQAINNRKARIMRQQMGVKISQNNQGPQRQQIEQAQMDIAQMAATAEAEAQNPMVLTEDQRQEIEESKNALLNQSDGSLRTSEVNPTPQPQQPQLPPEREDSMVETRPPRIFADQIDDGVDRGRENDPIMSPGATMVRGFFKRSFSKIEAGSVRASMLGMICAAVGSGVLTMPNVFERTGWTLGAGIIIGTGSGCGWSLYMITQRARHHGMLNYSTLTRKAGGPCLEKALQYSILLYMYATCLACEIVLTQIFVLLAHNIFGAKYDVIGNPNTNSLTGGPTTFKILETCLISCFILIPVSLNKSMSSFRILGVFSLSCLVFMVTVVVFEWPFYHDIYIPQHASLNFGVNAFCFSMDTFATAGIVFFAFTNQCNMFPVYSELVRPAKYRLMKIIKRAIVIVITCYIFMSFFGYFSTLDCTPPVIFERAPFSDQVQIDWTMTVATLLIGVVMVSNIATNYFPFRGITIYMITGKQEITTKLNLIITICFQFGTSIVCIMFPQVTDVLSIFGGIASTCICYLVPLTIYIRLRKPGESLFQFKYIAAIFYFSFLCVVGWLSSLTIILQMTIKDAHSYSWLACQRNQIPVPWSGCE